MGSQYLKHPALEEVPVYGPFGYLLRDNDGNTACLLGVSDSNGKMRAGGALSGGYRGKLLP